MENIKQNTCRNCVGKNECNCDKAENVSVLQAPKRQKITGDQEAWLRDRLISLVGLCFDIKENVGVGADKGMIEGAIEGAIERQALEIIELLNCEPEYTNLPKRTWWFSDRKKKNTGLLGMSPKSSQ